VLDIDTRELLRDGESVHLSPKAFQLLALLVTSRPRAISKDALCTHLWPNTFVVEANLSNLVGDLRAALGDDPRRPRFLRTVHAFGYAFQQPAESGSTAIERRCPILYQFVWAGRRATVAEGEHVLGRDPALDLCIDSSSVSRRHARLCVGGGKVVLEDLGSKNGTFVNGQRLTGAMSLSDRDQVRVGSVRLKFRILATQPSTETTGAE
jgi:DNA-binding winged helix-turn-helix (wHTH) protein